jgi:teichoic acid transport system permease protein
MDTTEHADPAARLRPVLTTPPASAYLLALWRRREFAVALPAEEMRVKHQNTFLGNLWHVGNPMLTVGVYYLVFGSMLGVNRGIDNYLLWLTIGVFVYRYISGGIQDGGRSIVSNLGMLRALQFPRALLPISVVIGNIFTLGFELAVLGALAVLTGEGISMRWFALPLVIAFQTMFVMGGAFITARLTDSFRDMQQLIPFVFRLVQFVSGVMYPIDEYLANTHGAVGTLIAWNPIVPIIDLYRWVLLGTPVDAVATARAGAISMVVLVLGFRYFIAAEDRYGRP